MNISKAELSTSIGIVLRDLRLAENKSIETLSNEIDIGYSQLSRIERGKINTSIYQLYRILTVLRIPMDTFLETLKMTIIKQRKSKRRSKRKKRKNEKGK